jgi:hypothetical protein
MDQAIQADFNHNRIVYNTRGGDECAYRYTRVCDLRVCVRGARACSSTGLQQHSALIKCRLIPEMLLTLTLPWRHHMSDVVWQPLFCQPVLALDGMRDERGPACDDASTSPCLENPKSESPNPKP